ncbi:MAG: ABC transporter ATP-binding protein [Bryobacterales bacterium]|nr:ABC transporter ATP-binding protein [Bryobacterales bacterium]
MKKVIAFENVSKAYRLGEGRSGIRDAITATGKRLLSKEKRSSQPVLMALNDVSFDVNQGEAVGVVGPNGAGKTTVMKLLSRITKATSGKVRSSGRVSSLIELGAGFHPDLTGRENIFLNGTILGMTRSEIRQRYEEIIDFSGLDGFLDTPVKRYSSGMYARLAFSVAAHTGADILLVDEVLAVGDLGFQAKSAQRMADLVSKGVTVLFISHSLYYVSSFCDRAILLNRGRLEQSGSTRDVIASYQMIMRERADAERAKSAAKHEQEHDPEQARLVEGILLDKDGNPKDRFETGEPMTLRVRGFAPNRLHNALLRFSIFSSEGVRCFSAHNQQDGVQLPDLEGAFEIDILFGEMQLMPDSYSVTVWLLEERGVGAHDWREAWVTFLVGHPTHDVAEGGLVFLPHEWRVNSVNGLDAVSPAMLAPGAEGVQPRV